MESETTKKNNSQSLCNFLSMNSDEESITESVEKNDKKQPSESPKETKIITMNKETNYWVSDKVKQKRKAYHREYYLRKKQEQQGIIERLKRHQLRGRSLTLMNISGKTAVRKIECEDDYERLISDLLSTLVDNGLLNDFSIESLQ